MLKILSSIPIADPIKAKESKGNIINGDIPSPMNIPSGCRFHTRCPYAKPICSEVSPALKLVEDDHLVSCHLY